MITYNQPVIVFEGPSHKENKSYERSVRSVTPRLWKIVFFMLAQTHVATLFRGVLAAGRTFYCNTYKTADLGK